MHPSRKLLFTAVSIFRCSRSGFKASGERMQIETYGGDLPVFIRTFLQLVSLFTSLAVAISIPFFCSLGFNFCHTIMKP